MNYSTISNDIVDVDKLIDQIKTYSKKFHECEEFFIHCKTKEHFERNLEARLPNSSYKIARIYASGRDLAGSVPSYIDEYLSIEQNGLLKTAIDKLEEQLRGLKTWAELEHLEVSKVYKESGYNEWSINHMLSKTLEMCNQIAEILIFINIIKSSYSYQLQAGEITSAEIRESTRAKMNTINNTGTFHNNQISNGDSNTNIMTVNQNNSEELKLICQKLIDVIDQSTAKLEEKDAVKAIVYEMQEAKNKSSIKDTYGRLTSAISNHITIGSLILGKDIWPVLTKFIMTQL